MGRESFWEAEAGSKRGGNMKKLVEEAVAELELSKKEDKIEKMETGLIETADFFIHHPYLRDKVYDWYASAMSRRGREPLGFDSFHYHFFEGASLEKTYSFGSEDEGFLFGFVKNEVFIPTHFLPKTMRGGYNLIKKLGESQEIPAVMSITNDLIETVEKMGVWNVLDSSLISSFRGMKVEKGLIYNNHPEVVGLMLGLMSEFVSDKEGDFAPEVDNDEKDEQNN
jgi:hypothetical protein